MTQDQITATIYLTIVLAIIIAAYLRDRKLKLLKSRIDQLTNVNEQLAGKFRTIERQDYTVVDLFFEEEQRHQNSSIGNASDYFNHLKEKAVYHFAKEILKNNMFSVSSYRRPYTKDDYNYRFNFKVAILDCLPSEAETSSNKVHEANINAIWMQNEY